MRLQWTRRFVRARFARFAKEFDWNTNSYDSTARAFIPGTYALDYMNGTRRPWQVIRYTNAQGGERNLTDRMTARELDAWLCGYREAAEAFR